MEKYELKKQDFEIINKLIKITSSIENLYKKLFDLEVQGKKDSDEFNKILDYLNIAIETEEKIYIEANLSYDQCVAIAEYLLEDRLPDSFLNDKESIISQNYSNRILRRILGILNTRIYSDQQIARDVLPDELIELMNHLGVENANKTVTTSMFSSIQLNEAFKSDLFSGYIVILEEFIQNDDYILFRDDLIRSKYNISFINKQIERDMLSNNFNIPDTLYSGSKLVADAMKFDFEIYDTSKNLYALEEATKQISRILELRDMDYNDKDKSLECILRQCFIRSALLLASDKTIDDIKWCLQEFTDSYGYRDNHPHDRVSLQLIKACLNSVKSDKNKVNVL